MTPDARKFAWGFGAVCGVFGIACGIAVGVMAGKNTDYRFFFVPAGLAAFLVGAFNWWLFIGWKSKVSVSRGILAGLLAGIGGQYVCWLLTLWGAWIAWKLGLFATHDVVDPFAALTGAAAFTFFSLLIMGWITVPGGAILGGAYALLQKKLEAAKRPTSA